MFEDIEDFGYDRDLDIEAETGQTYSNNIPPEEFFPTDLDLTEPAENIPQKRYKKSSLYETNDDCAIDWYLRADLDGNYSQNGRNSNGQKNEKTVEETIQRIQQYKCGFDSENTKFSGVLSDLESSVNKTEVYKFPPRNSINWRAVTSLDGSRYYILTKPELSVESNASFRCFRGESTLIENFSQILSMAEKMGVNRTLLTWLKLWDECVFKIVKPKTFPKLQSQPPIGKKFVKFQRKQQQPTADDLSLELDAHRRPQNKIALLCGPPGVGKTTLAHICARHCGYFIQEMNASDDRTLDAFRKQLENATQMTATLDGGSKPHCLIIDEIDGAPSASVDYLVNIVKDSNNGETNAKKVSSASKQVVKRPIICICNDLYAPSLKELRKIALVLHVPSIERRRLSDRLGLIGKKESKQFSSSVIENLCEKSEFDVRSCINTLQFLSIEDSTHYDFLKSDNIGVKDLHKSLFSVWQEIYTLPRINKRIQRILRIVDQCGEIDCVIEGLFENYLNINFKDPNMNLICNGLNWLQIVDHFDRVIATSQLFEFFAYKKYLPVLHHLYFAGSNGFPKLQFPQRAVEANLRCAKNVTVFQNILNETQPSIRCGNNLTTLILDVLPFLFVIIQPEFRLTNSQMFSDKERTAIAQLVTLMLEFNVTYRQERKADGHYAFVFEPPIDDLVVFSSLNNLNRKSMSAMAKQIIAREIEMTKVKCSEPRLVQRSNFNTSLNVRKTFVEKETKQYFQFGRETRKEKFTEDDDEGDNSERRKIPKIWFKFNENSSNAVRRSVKIGEML